MQRDLGAIAPFSAPSKTMNYTWTKGIHTAPLRGVVVIAAVIHWRSGTSKKNTKINEQTLLQCRNSFSNDADLTKQDRFTALEIFSNIIVCSLLIIRLRFNREK